jgi:hypothetical protein
MTGKTWMRRMRLLLPWATCNSLVVDMHLPLALCKHA